ncbi:hypothetical protein R1flu_027676 [Riccia fluitans]|uniref:Uncharacterized protein n=1 Tax=Riccia fluitans TaxID=41844 RepID=A0ABD1XNJ7_9MARC
MEAKEGITKVEGGVPEPKAGNMEAEEGVTKVEGGVTELEAGNMEVEEGVRKAKGGVSEAKTENMEAEEGDTEVDGGNMEADLEEATKAEGGVMEPHLEEAADREGGVMEAKEVAREMECVARHNIVHQLRSIVSSFLCPTIHVPTEGSEIEYLYKNACINLWCGQCGVGKFRSSLCEV